MRAVRHACVRAFVLTCVAAGGFVLLTGFTAGGFVVTHFVGFLLAAFSGFSKSRELQLVAPAFSSAISLADAVFFPSVPPAPCCFLNLDFSNLSFVVS